MATEAGSIERRCLYQKPLNSTQASKSTVGNAQEVEDAVLRIVETPVGEKQLRYRISAASFGVDDINALSRQVQPAC